MAMRQESVRLSLVDAFTPGMAKATAATALFKRSLDDLDGTSVRTSTSVDEIGDAAQRTDAKLRKSGADIDRYSGRLRLLVDTAVAVGPALIPIGGVGIAAVSGLANQFGFAAAGALSLVVAAQGVGDALEAVEKANLEPTAANMLAAEQAMSRIGPEAQQFVSAFQELRPVLGEIRDGAAAGWFPGLTDALDSLESAAPRIESLMRTIGEAGGDLVARGADALAGPEWAEFIAFLESEAPRSMEALAVSAGNVATGLAQMWMAFQPLNNSFGDWLQGATADFAEWSSQLGSSESFQQFADYIRQTGPQVAALMGSITDAFVGIVQAAAPLGGPVLAALTGLLEGVAAIAQSDLGGPIMTAVTAMSALRLASAGVNAGLGAVTSGLSRVGVEGDRVNSSMSRIAKAADTAVMGLAALAIVDSLQSDFEGLGLGLNEVTNQLSKLGEGDTTALTEQFDNLGASFERLADPNAAQALQDNISDAIGGIGGGDELKEARAQFEAIDAALTNLGATQGAQAAADAFGALRASLPTADIETLMGLLPQYRDYIAAIGNTRGPVKFSDDVRSMIGGVEAATGSIADFKSELESLNRLLEGRANVRDYEASLDDLSASFRENGRTLDINTAAGRANEAALDNIASTALRVAENLGPLKRGRFLEQARGDFIDAAQKLDLTRGQARQLATQFGLLNRQDVKPDIDANDKPAKSKLNSTERLMRELTGQTARPKVDADNKQATGKINTTRGDLTRLNGQTATPRVSVDIGSATAQINTVRNALASIPRSITTVVNTVRNVIGNPFGPPSAEGNFFPAVAYANGGMDRANAHQPELYRGGMTRVWGEPETKGEAYIPLANDYRRPRAKSILEMTAAEFNGQVTWFADGGLVGNTHSRTLSSETLSLDGIAQFDRTLQITSMTMGAFEDRMNDSVKGEKERGKKRLEQMREELDAQKEYVRNLKESAKSLGEANIDLVRRDLWSTDEQRSILPEGFANMDPAAARSWLAIQQQLGGGMESPEDRIRQTIADARERTQLIKRLGGMGLRGPGLQELLAAPTDQLRGYASDPAMARQFTRLFNQQEKVLSRLGGAAGDAGFGKQIAAGVEVQKDMASTLKRMDQRLQKLEKGGLKAIGEAAGAASGREVRGEMDRGKRNGTRG